MDMKMTHETISAFTDGELRNVSVDAVLSDLRAPQGRAAWDIYQKIGDVLRSEDMVGGFRPGFESRLFARLDAEPVVLAPVSVAAGLAPAAAVWPTTVESSNVVLGNFSAGKSGLSAQDPGKPAGTGLRRFFMPGAAAAAVAAITFMTAPQLMVALTKAPETYAGVTSPTGVATGNNHLAKADIKLAAAASTSALPPGSEAEHGDVLRDPSLDEYLMAHQRFSPSVYSTAQFARSSTFANEAGR